MILDKINFCSIDRFGLKSIEEFRKIDVTRNAVVWRVRLGLCVAIFFVNFLWMILQRMTFFCTVYTLRFFPLISTDDSEWSGVGGGIKLIKIHYLGWIPFLHVEHGCSSTWSWLFYSQYLRTSLWFYLDKLSILLKNVRRKICSGAQGRNTVCFNAICSVLPDDFLKNPYKCCRKNPYKLKKIPYFFPTWVSN